MTRLKLTPWLAIPVLLLTFGLALPIAHAAPPASDVIYLPMSGQPNWLKQGNKGLRTSVAGQVTIAQYGNADNLISNSTGFLAMRFDPPFNAPFTITGISFPSQTQSQIAATPGRFTSIRIQSMEAGDAGPGSLWSKQRAISCTANGTTTLTQVGDFTAPTDSDFTVQGVHVGDKVVGPKVANPTFVTSVGTTSLTTDVPVSPSVTATVTATIPGPRVIANVSSDLP